MCKSSQSTAYVSTLFKKLKFNHCNKLIDCRSQLPGFKLPSLCMRKILFYVLICWSSVLLSQSRIKGVVTDSLTRKPLAFVSISVPGQPLSAAMTDIDGKFSLQVSSLPAILNFSYVGYKAHRVSVAEPIPSNLVIRLPVSATQLITVEIKAGENPADRIVRTAWERRKKHDPEALNSYKCSTYNKMVITGRKDTAWKSDDRKEMDRGKKMDSLFSAQNLFMIESSNKRMFREGKLKELVIGSKISGITEASIFMLALKYQPFTFYPPLIDVSGKNFVNPISRNSDDLYFFSLEDTLYSGADSIFVISFKPRKNKVFEALQGVMYISAPDYALQNVIAEPARSDETTRIKIQQKYARLPDGTWFPVQLNTDLEFLNVKLPGNRMVGESRTYIDSVEINPVIRNSEFDQVALDVQEGSGKRSEQFWREVRIQDLTKAEQRTYRVLDSISRVTHMESRLKALESLIRGSIPIGWFDLNLRKVLAYNAHEGFRLGAGGLTNDKFAKEFALGGYFAYGFKDQVTKYGLESRIYLSRKKEVTCAASYSSDVHEAGGSAFINDRNQKSLEQARNIFLTRMDAEENTQLSLAFRWLKFLHSTAFFRVSHLTPLYDFSFDERPSTSRFTWAELGMNLRIAWNEQFYRSGTLLFPLKLTAPVFNLQYTCGQDLAFGGAYTFNRLDFRVEKKFTWRRAGETGVQFVAGMINGKLPYGKLFNGRGNYKDKEILKLAGMNSFEVMGMNEFVSDQYAAAFLQHDFGPLFRIKKFAPNFMLVQNSLFGSITSTNAGLQSNVDIKSPYKGYHEAGIQINNILTQSTAGYGIAGFYRYGAYSSSNWKDNVAIKLSLTLMF